MQQAIVVNSSTPQTFASRPRASSALAPGFCRRRLYKDRLFCGQTLSAIMMPKNVETLKNMNASTSKFAKWYVRVVDPKIKEYSFKSRGETVAAQKFECVLVSKDPAQYMLGLVPFSFSDRQAAAKALTKFRENQVLEITTPAFDPRARPEFNGCPVKPVLVLAKPTTIKLVPPTNAAMLEHPATGLTVSMDISDLLQFLKASGSAKALNKTFDFCGKFQGMSAIKSIEKGPVRREVLEAEFVDAKGGSVAVSFWDSATRMLESLALGAGVALVGCNATVAESEVKLNIWPGAHICTTGTQAQSLTSLDASVLDTQTLTATFTPGQDVLATMEEVAHPTCAAALADAVVDRDVTFQINRCMLDAPLQEDLLVTQGGRFFIKSCRLRDRTGGVDVDVLGSAVPALYGCSGTEELKAQIAAQSLTSTRLRLNARGIVRVESGITRRYVAKFEPTPLQAAVSMTAMRLCLGLSKVADDAVLAAPAARLLDAPLLGLAARRDSGAPLGAHRVLLLVEGTEETDCDPIDDTLPMGQQTFKVTSPRARCLLSDPATHVTLAGYCDFKKMMQYRLDKETALVLASAVTPAAPGSASAGSATEPSCVVTVEHMQKVSKDDAAALKTSMAAEWKSVLLVPENLCEQEYHSASDGAYWTPESVRKVRRVQSEPMSPLR